MHQSEFEFNTAPPPDKRLPEQNREAIIALMAQLINTLIDSEKGEYHEHRSCNGFETLNSTNLQAANKRHHPLRDCRAAIRRLSDLGVMINASFVFGMDDDDTQDFQRTVDWALEMGVISAIFHILTPYPGTRLFARLKNEGRLLTENWSSYNTREVVFRPKNMSAEALKAGYDQAYRSFYQWGSIARSSMAHMDRPSHALRQFCYSAGWKKFEPLWSAAIKLKQLGVVRPLLETLLMTHQKAAIHPTGSRHCVPEVAPNASNMPG